MKRREPYSEERAMQYALRSLGRKMQTRRELLDKLQKRTTTEVAEAVVARLAEWGYLDDAAYAEAFVNGHKKRWGPLRLRAELLRRGVSEELVRAALDYAESEAGLALKLLQKHAWRHKGEKAKMIRFLQARGFPLAEAIEAADAFRRLRAEDESG